MSSGTPTTPEVSQDAQPTSGAEMITPEMQAIINRRVEELTAAQQCPPSSSNTGQPNPADEGLTQLQVRGTDGKIIEYTQTANGQPELHPEPKTLDKNFCYSKYGVQGPVTKLGLSTTNQLSVRPSYRYEKVYVTLGTFLKNALDEYEVERGRSFGGASYVNLTLENLKCLRDITDRLENEVNNCIRINARRLAEGGQNMPSQNNYAKRFRRN